MASKHPDVIEANVNIKNQSDVEEESLEMQDISKPKVWSESEKPQRPSLLQRIRSSRSKSKDEPSSGEESEPEPEEESSIGEEDERDEDLEEDRDEITSLGGGGGEIDNNKRKFGKSLPPKRPSFQKQTSRYEDRLRNEDLAVQAAYEKRKESKKLSEITKTSKTKDIQPTLEEAYDFFTKENWGPADHTPTTTVKFETTDESEQVETGQDEDLESSGQLESDKKNLLPASHYIGDKYLWEVTEKSEPYINEKNNDQIFIASTDKVDIANKLGKDQQPRFLQDEGMFIGVTPTLSKSNRNQNKFEQRILKEQEVRHEPSSKWFGSDGKLVALPNPVTKTATRPPIFDDELTTTGANGEDSLTFWCPPSLPGPDGLPTPINPSGTISNISKCQLEIDLSSIVFDHHHLFSLEHYLTRRLNETYVLYSKVKTSQASKDLEKRLDILYSSVEDLKSKQSTWNTAADSEEKLFQTRRLETYRTEIKTIRAEKDADSLKERELTRALLKLWKEIRKIRNQQGFSNTFHKLVIKNVKVNASNDRQKWDVELQRELQEAKEDFDVNFEKKMKNFQDEMEKWKEMHNKRREARKRQKQRQKDAERGSGTADATEMAEDDALLAEVEAEKPEEPKPYNEMQIKAEIEKAALTCRRPPGENKIYLELMTSINTNGNPPPDVQDNRELQRRIAVSKTKVFTRISFNGKEVCQSTSRPMHPDFVIPIGQIFPIQIVQLPETLKLQIIEGGTIKSTLIAEIKLPISEPTKTLSDCSLEPIEFKSAQLTKHEEHAGLGSGYTFATSVDGTEISTEFTKGRLFARVGWARGIDGQILSPPVDQWCPRKDSKLDPLHEVMEPDGKIDPNKLEEWITKARLDPNDPENEDLIGKVNEARRKADVSGSSTHVTSKMSNLGSTLSTGYFRLDQHHDQLIFCTDQEIRNNPRFQMIQLRRAKVPEFKNYRMIPILDKEVPKDLLEARTRRALAKGREVMDKGDPLRGRSRLFLEQLRTQVNHRFSLARHRRRHADVVNEDPIPDSGTLKMICGEMVPAQRPLRPIRIERKKVLMQDMTNQEIKILLSIVRAYDVPVRSDLDPLLGQGGAVGAVAAAAGGPLKIRQDSVNEASVYSYVEAQFQGQTLRTTVAIGPNPAWNQELTLVFKPLNNDFSPETLNRVKDSLHLHLFDEVTVDLVDANDDSETNSSQVHQRIEKKWLGSLSIPFSSLYKNTRIEGTFKLHSPPVLLGYERSGVVGGLSIESTETSVVHGLGGGLAKNTKNATYLNIYATLQPALIVPEPVKEKLDCDEPDHVVQHCLEWSETLAQKYPQRKINPMVADVTGKSVLLTRYFRPLKPPQELLTSEPKALNIAWYISLIPYVPSNGLFPGLQDIWPTSDQFLQMMVGSETEHAVLLCNFFAYIGKKAFLILGQGVPEGDTAYVLTVEENGDNLLWNPVSGEQYSISEHFCPLERVYVIANEGNLWGNIQSGDKPGRLRWDISNTADWTPLFSGSTSNPGLPSVQPYELFPYGFTAPDARAAKQLKERIERTLRDTLMNHRKKMKQRTTMNFQGKRLFERLLPSLESSKGGLNMAMEGSNTSISDEHLRELQRIMSSHKICGFPLHFSFGDIDQLIESVTATGVHLNRENGVEFALAVHVEPYHNYAMSVWVYVASLVRRR